MARDHPLTYKYSGHDPGVCCRCFSGLVLWQQGNLDLATTRCQEALDLAESLSHPLTTALACWALSYLHMFRGEPEAAKRWAEREMAICEEYMLPLLLSQGLFQAGWAITQLGELTSGIEQMERGIQAIRKTGAEMGLPYFLGLLGETHARAGDRKRAIEVIDQAIAKARTSGSHFQFSELLRLKAEIKAQAKDCDRAQVEALFRSAIDSARSQGAVIPELRAATSLARHFAARRRGAEARDLLAPYAGFVVPLQDSVDARMAAELFL